MSPIVVIRARGYARSRARVVTGLSLTTPGIPMLSSPKSPPAWWVNPDLVGNGGSVLADGPAMHRFEQSAPLVLPLIPSWSLRATVPYHLNVS
jgi:hypothetical protein